MKCERMRELMSAYIDDELNEVDKAKFEKHLAQCPECKEEYELLLNIVSECNEINEVELPEDFREELHNKLMQAKEGKSRGLSDFIRRNRWKVYSGTATAAVLILALSFSAFNGPKTDVPMAQSTAPKAGIQFGTDFTIADTGKSKIESASNAAAPSVPNTAPAPKTLIQNEGQNNLTVTSEPAPDQNKDTRMQGITAVQPTLVAPNAAVARKIIKNGNVSVKVTDVQIRINELTALAEQMGGHVENSSVMDVSGNPVPIVPDGDTSKEKTTKIGSITLRVPSDKFDGTFQSILKMGTVENQSTNTDDITKQYMDLESRMNNLKIQEKTYQDLLSKTNTVEETLKVENEINRIRTEIDVMQGDLKRWNDQVDYSTIYVNLTEVKEAELEKVDTSSVWHRARQGLINTVNNIKHGIAWLFVFIVSALPYIVILGGASLLAVYMIKRRKGKSE